MFHCSAAIKEKSMNQPMPEKHLPLGDDIVDDDEKGMRDNEGLSYNWTITTM